jgi:hypothetical protein
MGKYLYLTHVAWSDAWINGGEIPISVASTYISDEREGIFTPDENLIHDSTTDLKSLFVHLEQVKGFTMTGCSFNGRKIDIVNASYYTEDGLILSFCNEFSPEIAHRMGKKCCVRIFDVDSLIRIIDKQLGRKGQLGDCNYTFSHQRNHFLKSNQDSWQKEHRLFWKGTKSQNVTLPAGMAELVTVF